MIIIITSFVDLSKNVMKNTTVLVILKLWVCVDSDNSVELFASVSDNFNFLTNFKVTSIKVD
jgi:hypothetical protein